MTGGIARFARKPAAATNNDNNSSDQQEASKKLATDHKNVDLANASTGKNGSVSPHADSAQRDASTNVFDHTHDTDTAMDVDDEDWGYATSNDVTDDGLLDNGFDALNTSWDNENNDITPSDAFDDSNDCVFDGNLDDFGELTNKKATTGSDKNTEINIHPEQDSQSIVGLFSKTRQVGSAAKLPESHSTKSDSVSGPNSRPISNFICKRGSQGNPVIENDSNAGNNKNPQVLIDGIKNTLMTPATTHEQNTMHSASRHKKYARSDNEEFVATPNALFHPNRSGLVTPYSFERTKVNHQFGINRQKGVSELSINSTRTTEPAKSSLTFLNKIKDKSKFPNTLMPAIKQVTPTQVGPYTVGAKSNSNYCKDPVQQVQVPQTNTVVTASASPPTNCQTELTTVTPDISSKASANSSRMISNPPLPKKQVKFTSPLAVSRPNVITGTQVTQQIGFVPTNLSNESQAEEFEDKHMSFLASIREANDIETVYSSGLLDMNVAVHIAHSDLLLVLADSLDAVAKLDDLNKEVDEMLSLLEMD